MSRLYRVRVQRRDGEWWTVVHAVPSDVADGYVHWLENDSQICGYDWKCVRVETEVGGFVREVVRAGA